MNSFSDSDWSFELVLFYSVESGVSILKKIFRKFKKFILKGLHLSNIFFLARSQSILELIEKLIQLIKYEIESYLLHQFYSLDDLTAKIPQARWLLIWSSTNFWKLRAVNENFSLNLIYTMSDISINCLLSKNMIYSMNFSFTFSNSIKTLLKIVNINGSIKNSIFLVVDCPLENDSRSQDFSMRIAH
jgi:hypothetical protein